MSCAAWPKAWRDGRFFPIEIKGKTRLSRSDTRGITSFRETYPGLKVAPGLVIGLCDKVERLTSQAVAMPWDVA